MIGSVFEIQSNMKKLSNPELLQLAQGAPTGNPIEQYAAVSELDMRRQMTAPPQQSQTTVLQDMTNQLMVNQPQPTPAPGDPVGSGIAAIAQQQAAQQPQAMREGGEIRGYSVEKYPGSDEKDPFWNWQPENIPDLGFMQALGGVGDLDTSGMRRSDNILELAPRADEPRAPEGQSYQTLGAQSIYDEAPYLLRTEDGRIVALPTTDDEGAPIPRAQAEEQYRNGMLASIGHYPNEEVALRDLLHAPTGVHDKTTKMDQGGRVTGSRRTNQLLESVQQVQNAISGNYDTTARTPEEARELVSGFQGQDYLSPLLARQDERDAETTDQRRRNLWLALARGGFTAAGTPGSFGRAVSAGGIAGIDAATQAFGAYNDSMDRSEDRRYNIAGAQQGRSDAQGRAGLEAFLGGERDANSARRQLLSDASGLAESGQRADIADQDRAAADARQANQIQQLAQHLLQANAGQWREDPSAVNLPVIVGAGPDGVTGTDDDVRQEAPTMRPYNEQDAISDAISLLNGGRGGRGAPDDLNEVLRSNLAIVQDQYGIFSEEEKRAAGDIVAAIGQGRLGNSGTTTNANPGAGVATGTQTAGERASMSVDPSQIEAFRRARGGVTGQQNGQDVIDPYLGQR